MSSDEKEFRRLEKKALRSLFDSMVSGGYRIIGPKIANNAIVYRELSSIDDLPKGWIDVQDGGSYHLEQTGGEAYFGYVVGPDSPKRFLFPPERTLWSAEKNGKDINITIEQDEYPKTALLGVRPCELAAVAIQDKIFAEGEYVDPTYKARRDNTLLIAVNCTRAGNTCFCASMGTGPRAGSGYDIALTEVGGDNGYFIVESGSNEGDDIVNSLSLNPATSHEIDTAENAVNETVRCMGRTLETSGLKELLQSEFNSPRYDDIALRCLACGNCTLVCPTCFCSTVIDTTDLSGNRSERIRRWDSCFNIEHSYIHGGYIRGSIMARYRQWITHKLVNWIDQFGMAGCVGCGRCITWCPVGIDITEEAGAIRKSVKENVKVNKG
ncbi:MAG: 4Fe-4S dicluster domain-containing protein [Candidatus Zixiibacteriota bacterium]|nr:MAG: 4Fe-4S dicluster domain-containing protein [candidate division Zixibacteria bacterium]